MATIEINMDETFLYLDNVGENTSNITLIDLTQIQELMFGSFDDDYLVMIVEGIKQYLIEKKIMYSEVNCIAETTHYLSSFFVVNYNCLFIKYNQII